MYLVVASESVQRANCECACSSHDAEWVLSGSLEGEIKLWQVCPCMSPDVFHVLKAMEIVLSCHVCDKAQGALLLIGECLD